MRLVALPADLVQRQSVSLAAKSGAAVGNRGGFSVIRNAETKMLVQSVKLKWTWLGAAVGLLTKLSDFAEWRGPKFAAWAGEGVSYNLSMIGGSVLGGALLGFVAGAIRDSFARRSGRLN